MTDLTHVWSYFKPSQLDCPKFKVKSFLWYHLFACVCWPLVYNDTDDDKKCLRLFPLFSLTLTLIHSLRSSAVSPFFPLYHSSHSKKRTEYEQAFISFCVSNSTYGNVHKLGTSSPFAFHDYHLSDPSISILVTNLNEATKCLMLMVRLSSGSWIQVSSTSCVFGTTSDCVSAILYDARMLYWLPIQFLSNLHISLFINALSLTFYTCIICNT